MKIVIVKEPVSEEELRKLAEEFYKTMLKGVVDVERKIMAVGGEFHIDSNNVLLAHDSKQENIWGFNLYFDREGDERVECISLINIRPAQDNPAMEILDESLRKRMKEIILNLIS